MGYRRRSRELAMQALFFMDIQGKSIDAKDMVALFLDNFKPSKKSTPFFLTLINGVIENKDTIDRIIEQISSNWKVSRMSGVDRNILRIAVFELMGCPDIPTRVTLTGVFMHDPHLGWAVGHDGIILGTRDGGESWTDLTGNLPNLPPWGTISNIE